MDNLVYVKTYDAPPVDKKEILRYMGMKKEDEEIVGIIDEALEEVYPSLSYKVCYTHIPVDSDGCINLVSKVNSNNLKKNLKGAKEAVLFCATIGIEIDRLINKYSKLSPVKALCFQGIGAERIEALCDAFCNDIKGEYNLKPRFSPGYGDFDVSYQKEIFKILEPFKKIGVALNESMLMSPSKSVTAIVGLTNEEADIKKCENCSNKTCEFRRVK